MPSVRVVNKLPWGVRLEVIRTDEGTTIELHRSPTHYDGFRPGKLREEGDDKGTGWPEAEVTV